MYISMCVYIFIYRYIISSFKKKKQTKSSRKYTRLQVSLFSWSHHQYGHMKDHTLEKIKIKFKKEKKIVKDQKRWGGEDYIGKKNRQSDPTLMTVGEVGIIQKL